MPVNISVLLPARNEEEIIGDTIKQILYFLKKSGMSFEIIVIVNGSVDSTEKIISAMSAKEPRIRVLKSTTGYGNALRLGLKKAIGEYIVIYNVDFFDTHLIDLVRIDLYGKDLIIGSKRAHWSSDFRPINRKIVSYLFNLYLSLLFDFKGSDTHGIKVLKKAVRDKILPQCKTYTGIFDTEFVLRSQMAGYKIADFPVDVKEIRSSRFTSRLLQTPKDIIELTLALKNVKN